jgi:hypothetical protein
MVEPAVQREGSSRRKRILIYRSEAGLVEGKDFPVRLNSPESTATSRVFLNVNYEQEGTHWIEILLDGDLKSAITCGSTRLLPPPGMEPQG